jgi:uncharacterized protein
MHFPELILALVAFLAGIIKSGFGIGAGIFLTPFLALVMNPKEAVVLVAPMMLFTDLTAVFQYWGRWDKQDILTLIPPCLIGALVGALLLNWFTPSIARRTIGLIGLLYIGSELLRKTVFQSVSYHHRAQGILIGLVGGLTSALANSGGVFISIYLRGRLSKVHFVGTLVGVFLFLNLTKVSLFTGMGMLNGPLWLIEFYLLPLMFIGGVIGKWINTRIQEKQFANWIFALLVAACLKLLLF